MIKYKKGLLVSLFLLFEKEAMHLKKSTKRMVIIGFIVGMIITMLTPVFADSDFEADEDKYITLCSSKSLSQSQQNTCKKFNTYLKQKSKEVREDISETKQDISETSDDIDAIKDKIEKNEQEIVTLEIDIKQLEQDIKDLESTISQKKELLGDRLYAMQSLSNSNDFLYFIMGAQDFTTAYRRAKGIKELTEADQEEIDELSTQYNTLQIQQNTLQSKKKSLEHKQEENKTLQKKYESLLAKQKTNLKNSQQESSELSDAQKEIDKNLTRLFEESLKEQSSTNVGQITKPSNGQSSTSSSEIGIKIANKALTRQGCRYWWGAPGGGYGDGQGLDNSNAQYFDCSGLVAWAHRQSGIMIGRTTAAGYSQSGKSVSYSNLQPGDVITFSYGGGVAHIGIYIGNQQFVHASGSGSGTRGQYANQCVKVSSIAPGGYWYNYMYNCRRLY